MRETFGPRLLTRLDHLSPENLRDLARTLHHERASLQGILDAVSDAVMALDREGGLTYWNRATLRLLGLTGESSGQRAWEAVAEPAVAELIRRAVVGEEKIAGEEAVLRRAGEATVSVTVHPHAEEGRLEGFVVIATDVTSRKADSLRRHHEESLASLAALTAGVAHEIKNPLGSLDLHLQLIERFLKDRKFKEKEELLELTSVVGEEIRRLDRIVNDFLFSVRPIRMTLRPESLSRVVDETLKVLAPEFKAADIEVACEHDPHIPPQLLDAAYMRQALLNLLKNSIQAIAESKRQGLIRISTSRHGASGAALVVGDNGAGIPKEALTKIFEPFFTTKATGTGLGLTIVYRIVKEHGGEIVLSSDPNRGTEFRIELGARQDQRRLEA